MSSNSMVEEYLPEKVKYLSALRTLPTINRILIIYRFQNFSVWFVCKTANVSVGNILLTRQNLYYITQSANCEQPSAFNLTALIKYGIFS